MPAKKRTMRPSLVDDVCAHAECFKRHYVVTCGEDWLDHGVGVPMPTETHTLSLARRAAAAHRVEMGPDHGLFRIWRSPSDYAPKIGDASGYAGVAGALYGRNSQEKAAYAKRERDAWSK